METFKVPVGTPQTVREISLIPSSGGRYEIFVDDKLVYSKLASGSHIDTADAVELVRRYIRA